MYEDRLNARASRWISVTFLQGGAADEAIGMIDRDGPAAAIAHLRLRDHGDETVDAALTNGYVYDNIPAGSSDRTIEDDGSPYALTYSAQYRYVSLLRRYAAPPESEVLTPGTTSTRHAQSHQGTADVWSVSRGRSSTSGSHTVAL